MVLHANCFVSRFQLVEGMIFCPKAPKKQTAKFMSAKFQKVFLLSYIIWRIQSLDDKQYRSRWIYTVCICCLQINYCTCIFIFVVGTVGIVDWQHSTFAIVAWSFFVKF